MSRILPETKLLLEIGHVALANGMAEDALEIMERLTILVPDDPHPQIGRALARYVSGRHTEAIEDLRETILRFPNAVFARSLLARFMKSAGRTGWEDVVHEVLSMNPPEFVARLARELLDNASVSQELLPNGGNVSTNQVSEHEPSTSSGFPPGFKGTMV